MEIWQSCLVRRGDIRGRFKAVVGCNRVSLDGVRPFLRQDDRGAGNHYVDLTRYQILHRGGCSAIRHKLTTRASQLLKDNPGDVRRAADPAYFATTINGSVVHGEIGSKAVCRSYASE